MRERDLERAYSERFERRAADEIRLATITHHLGDQVDLSEGCWMVGAAVPTSPAPGASEPPRMDAIVRLIQASLETGLKIAPLSNTRSTVIRELNDAALNPRVGLRRWVARTSGTQDPADRSDYVHLEAHHDGSVGLAVRLNGWYPQPEPPKNYVPIQIVGGLCADLTALAAQSAVRVGPATQMLLRLDLARSDELPFGLITNRTVGGLTLSDLTQPTWTRDVRRFLPVDSTLQPDEDIEGLKSVAQGIYVDVLSEFGYDADGTIL
jgi:hypothetical protein